MIPFLKITPEAAQRMWIRKPFRFPPIIKYASKESVKLASEFIFKQYHDALKDMTDDNPAYWTEPAFDDHDMVKEPSSPLPEPD